MRVGDDRADTSTVSIRPRPLIRSAAVAAVAAMLVTALSGCGQLDSFTGSQSMRWVGDKVLAKDPVKVAQYRALPLLPKLTASEAARAFGQDPDRATAPATDTDVTGTGWSVKVAQSPFTTAVRFTRTCQTLVKDKTKAIAGGKQVLTALGANVDDWSWFVVYDGSGTARAIAEPKIEGHQTWATGSMAVLSDETGVCAANGVLMRFEKTGKTQTLPAAYTVFQQARHSKGLAKAGEYRTYEQTWTLVSGGVLGPLWRFASAKQGIVAVNLGDGLETALDTESMLSKAAKSHTTPTAQ